MPDPEPIAGGSVIVIDDEATICNGCKLVLSEHAHSVHAFQKGMAGVEAVFRDGCDVLLLDLKLPDMDGMEILKRVRRDRPEIYVIIMTGYASVQSAVEAMKVGAFDYLSKPFSGDELLFAVEKAVHSKRLTEENVSLRKQLFAKFNFSNIVGENPVITRIFKQIQKAAPTDSTILLEGESGTGKEIFANAIHAHSKRAARQFIVVDCSTFSSSLLESELFGHVKGAFTGAVKDKAGVFEIAHGGTLFLDEIANLNLEIQAKLLRVMETRQYKPVGGEHTRKTDARIIAATNQNLKSLVEEGKFREDLFYRLCVLPIYIPPLKARKDDIPKLAYHFLRIYSKEMGRRIQGFSDDALEALIHYDWPGNVRQLKNVVERLVIMCEDKVLCYRHLSSNLQMVSQAEHGSIPETLAELKAAKQAVIDHNFGPVEKAFLIKALKNADGNITRAAKQVGMQRSNFSSLMKKHDVAAKP